MPPVACTWPVWLWSGSWDWLWTITFVACHRSLRGQGGFRGYRSGYGFDELAGVVQLEQASNSGTLPKVIVPVHLWQQCAMDWRFLVRPTALRLWKAPFVVLVTSSNLWAIASSAMPVFSRSVKITTEKVVPLRPGCSFGSAWPGCCHGITKDPAEFELEPAGPGATNNRSWASITASPIYRPWVESAPTSQGDRGGAQSLASALPGPAGAFIRDLVADP